MTIRSRPASEAYRDGWDRVFGKKPSGDGPPGPGWEISGYFYGRPELAVYRRRRPLNPHDATEHPEAD